MTITDVQEGHSGDRVCVDLLSMLEEGEGMLVGSTAKAFVLIHGETISSKYVPTRPFRVNAGVLMRTHTWQMERRNTSVS